MAKIGDLFVRLGLKSGEFKKGIQEAQTSTQNFGDKVKNLSAAAKVAWAAIGVAVAKFATNFVKMTQTLGDQWDIAMGGIKGSYGAFVRQLSSGEGWSNLFTNMAEAGRLAREVASSLDEVFERKVSLGYAEAETNRTISELQLIMRDASKSDEDRIAAAEEIIRLEKVLGETKREVAQQEADAQKKLFMSQTGLNKEETDYLLKNYNLNRDSINQARDYLAERQRLQTKLFAAQEMSNADSGISTQEAEANVQKAQLALDNLDSSTSQAIKDLAELTRKYDKSNDELVNNMANAEMAVINVDTEVNRASMRATAMKGSLTEASARSAGGSNPEKDAADKILQRAQDSAKTEVELLTEKYNTEYALLQKYGKDTTALTEEYYRNLLADVTAEIEAELEKIEEIEPVEITPVTMEIDTSPMDEFFDKYKYQIQQAQAATNAFSGAVVAGFANSCQELMDQMHGLSESNGWAVLKALLEPLADMAVRTGEIIMAEGLAIEAAKAGLFAFSGIGAIAAGAALIAIGAAAKSGLAALASSGSASGATYSSAGASSATSSTASQNIQSELTVYVKGTIKGSDIVLAGNNTLNQWNR